MTHQVTLPEEIAKALSGFLPVENHLGEFKVSFPTQDAWIELRLECVFPVELGCGCCFEDGYSAEEVKEVAQKMFGG